MAFSSVQFLFVFLPLSLAVYWLCPKWLRNAVLAAFSLLFFAWAGLKGAAILVLLAGINWLGGLSLGRLAHKRPLLILLILLDLAVLGGFKYAGFAAETVNALVPGLLPVLSPALPLGLSFYVFTAIGYCADVAAGKVESEKNPIRFAVFLTFFGHGPSGPIVRYGQQAPQLDPGSETRRVSADRFCYGIKRLVLGLAKKAIIADQLALIYAKVASVPAATLPAKMAPLPCPPPRRAAASAPTRLPMVTACARSMRVAMWRWVTWASSWPSTPASSDSWSSCMMSPVWTKTEPPGTAKAFMLLCSSTLAVKGKGCGGKVLERRSTMDWM